MTSNRQQFNSRSNPHVLIKYIWKFIGKKHSDRAIKTCDDKRVYSAKPDKKHTLPPLNNSAHL